MKELIPNAELATISKASNDNKRKLSVSVMEDSSASKKPKLEQPAAPLRYVHANSHSTHHSRDRERSTVIASKFPENTTEEQVRHFFKDV